MAIKMESVQDYVEGVKTPAAKADCSKKHLKTHKFLHRTISTLAILFRTKEIGFKAFLLTIYLEHPA